MAPKPSSFHCTAIFFSLCSKTVLRAILAWKLFSKSHATNRCRIFSLRGWGMGSPCKTIMWVFQDSVRSRHCLLTNGYFRLKQAWRGLGRFGRRGYEICFMQVDDWHLAWRQLWHGLDSVRPIMINLTLCLRHFNAFSGSVFLSLEGADLVWF